MLISRQANSWNTDSVSKRCSLHLYTASSCMFVPDYQTSLFMTNLSSWYWNHSSGTGSGTTWNCFRSHSELFPIPPEIVFGLIERFPVPLRTVSDLTRNCLPSHQNNFQCHPQLFPISPRTGSCLYYMYMYVHNCISWWATTMFVIYDIDVWPCRRWIKGSRSSGRWSLKVRSRSQWTGWRMAPRWRHHATSS